MAEEMCKLFPEKYERIVQDEHLLRKPSYSVDTDDPTQMAIVKECLEEAEDILFIKRELGLVDKNIIGFGLAGCQLKKIMDVRQEAPRISIVRVPRFDGSTNKPLSLDLINPQIIDMSSPTKYKDEGCLSIPGLRLRQRGSG